jgi:glycosyltransferase involved in cell wall biosynthesis
MSEEISEIRVGKNVLADPPRVSIIIPNYKTASYIAETLESVRAQTFRDLEVIVINDGAPDSEELYEVLRPYYDEITFIDKMVNSGTSATRNLAAGYARGTILSFLDGDDIWHPTFLEEVLSFKDQGGYDMAYTDAETFGQFHQKVKDLLHANPDQSCEITRELMLQERVHCLPSGALIDKDNFEMCGGFDPSVKRCEDIELWMRFTFAGVRIGYLRKILFKFRLRPESGSGDLVQRAERGLYLWRKLKSTLKFSEEENARIDAIIKYQQSCVLRAEGRTAIYRRNWDTARTKFAEASAIAAELKLPLGHRLRMAGVRFLLNLSPEIVRQAQVGFRKRETAFMPGEQ